MGIWDRTNGFPAQHDWMATTYAPQVRWFRSCGRYIVLGYTPPEGLPSWRACGRVWGRIFTCCLLRVRFVYWDGGWDV